MMCFDLSFVFIHMLLWTIFAGGEHPCSRCYSSNVLYITGGGAFHFARLFLTPKYLW